MRKISTEIRAAMARNNSKSPISQASLAQYAKQPYRKSKPAQPAASFAQTVSHQTTKARVTIVTAGGYRGYSYLDHIVKRYVENNIFFRKTACAKVSRRVFGGSTIKGLDANANILFRIKLSENN